MKLITQLHTVLWLSMSGAIPLHSLYALWCEEEQLHFLNFDVLLTVHLRIFISVINQLDAQNCCLQ